MEEDVELMKAQLEAVKKQRDDYKVMLVELLDRVHSGFYNHFNLPHETLVNDEGKEVSPLTDGFDAFVKVLHRHHYFHLARLLECMKEYEVLLNDQHATKAELSVLLEKWKLPEEIERYRNSFKSDDENDLPTVDIKQLAGMLVLFAHEFDFHRHYPGDEPDIYAEAFTNIVRLAMKMADIPRTPEGIEATLKEFYEKSKGQ